MVVPQSWRKMERKTSATEEDGEEDINHEEKLAGSHQTLGKISGKISPTEEDGQEDI